ncbi:MAG TPA: DUF72 domain-containing protein [Miltoncostaeaceae bacterium]|nr:DUF72 domain-containing protein [Miltoncostaeaceae bacterium]
MSLHLGTSGWSYPEWSPALYPRGLARGDYLAHYARHLGACEVNGTFHRLQPPGAVARWASAVPAGFRFAVKAHRALTHARAFPPPPGDRVRAAFLDSIAPLGALLGTVLVPVPPHRTRDEATLAALLGDVLPGPPLTLELKDPSWDVPEVREAVAAAGATVCLTHRDGPVPEALHPGPHAYVRLRAEAYTPAERDGWADLLRREARHRPVFAFARHQGLPPDDPSCGLGLARWLAGRAGAPAAPPPP